MYSDVQNAWSQGYPARVIQDRKTAINQRAVGLVGGRGKGGGGRSRRVGFLGLDVSAARLQCHASCYDIQPLTDKRLAEDDSGIRDERRKARFERLATRFFKCVCNSESGVGRGGEIMTPGITQLCEAGAHYHI